MNNKSISILILITLVVLVATYVAVDQESKLVKNDPSNQYLLDDLKRNINDVAQIDIVSGKDRLNIKLNNGEWQLTDKYNYSADLGKVKDVIFGLTNMTKVEAKTKKAENYAKLGLEDPQQENATSKLIILSNAKGDKLTQLILGNTRPGSNTQYVRSENAPQAWLISPALKVDLLALNWLDKQLMHISKDRIKKLVITQDDGKQLVITKESADSGDHVVEDFPEGKKLSARFEPRNIATVLENFSLEDVRKSDAIDFESAPVIKAEYQTFDGLKISTLVLEKDGLYYAKFSVVSEPTNAETGTVKDEASTLNAKLSPWIYVIPKTKYDLMVKKMSDLIKPEEKPPAHPQ